MNTQYKQRNRNYSKTKSILSASKRSYMFVITQPAAVLFLLATIPKHMSKEIQI